MNPPPSPMVDLAFALSGAGPSPSLPRRHRRALADAVGAVLPWLADAPGAGVHPVKLSTGAGPQALLPRRARLLLRLPRDRADAALALCGRELSLGPTALRVGAALLHELVPHGTLYAHLVASDDADEIRFAAAVGAELAALGLAGRPICGLHQVEDDELQGFSLMLDGLGAEASLQLLERGLGAHRRLGCGLFVPHKSAAAVGAPA